MKVQKNGTKAMLPIANKRMNSLLCDLSDEEDYEDDIP